MDAEAIARAGIRAADAALLTERALRTAEIGVAVTGPVVAAGKAAWNMAGAIPRGIGHITNRIILTPHAATLPAFTTIVAGHPVPNEGSEMAGRRALEIARALGDDERLLVLLSGGASALMAAPAQGITLSDKIAVTERLLREGADIHDLNMVRKHLSAVKGGQLAAACGGRCDTFVISDVVGDDPSFIASGPTVPDPTTFAQALDVLHRFGGEEAYPRRVVTRLKGGAACEIEETPKPGDPRLEGATTRIVGSRFDAMRGAAEEGRGRGYTVVEHAEPIVGESRVAGAHCLRRALIDARAARGPLCIVSSGETTVRVTGRGRGGRNQEFALAAIGALDELHETTRLVALASVGTDGVDGPTDAAGALVDSGSVERARAAGLLPARFLADNDAYSFFDALGDLIRTGPTGTNVGDLQVILIS